MPAWTYDQLKAADASLDPIIPDPVAAAATLNAQTVVLPPQAVSTRFALEALIRTTTFDWSKIVLRSRGSISNPSSPTSQDMAVYAAIAAITLLESTSQLNLADPAAWAVFNGALTILQAAGDVSASAAAALTALRTPTVPVWEPPVSDQDVTSARELF